MEMVETIETYVDLAVCDMCGSQGPHCCQKFRDRLVVHHTTYKGRPVQIITLPENDPIPANGVLMRLDPPDCCLTVWC